MLPALVSITAIGLRRGLAWLERVAGDRPWKIVPIVAVVALAIGGTVSFYRTYQGPYIARSADWWGYGSGAALTTAGGLVPSGGELCIATNDISGFTFTHQVMYYLPVRDYTITKGVEAPVCSEPGTIRAGAIDARTRGDGRGAGARSRTSTASRSSRWSGCSGPSAGRRLTAGRFG